VHIVADSDRQIVEKVRSGNSRTYALLVDRHKERAMTLALRLLGSKEEAEELVQDAFLRAYKNLDTFRGDAKFSTWLYRILYNLCMTKVTRRKGKMEHLEEEDRMTKTMLVDDEEISIQERIEHEEITKLVATEIESLPEKLKTVILLFYVQDMSYDEMSAVMNIPVGSVKTYLHRGRNMLRQRVLSQLKGEVSLT